MGVLVGGPQWVQSRRRCDGRRLGGQHRRHGKRHLTAVPMSTHPRNHWVPGSYAVQPLTLKLLIPNARSVNNKAISSVIFADLLIMDQIADLACITGTWLGVKMREYCYRSCACKV